ncbi:MAG: hypothetical protein WBB60_16850 [Nitrospira sp.]|nr:hypothetical protein [Nitrospira sp.]HQY59229.1 hypothetical protein [Nitrospira sp.]HRA95345.1 hypothetical protein [Nitrospira sp.]
MNTYHHFATVLTQLLGSETAVRLTVSGSLPYSSNTLGNPQTATAWCLSATIANRMAT